MPEREMSTATWLLPELDLVEIAYTTHDRFGNSDGDPCELFAQTVHGDVVGVVYDDGGVEARVPLGHVELVLVDLWELETKGERLFDVLDSGSGDWASCYTLTLGDDPVLNEYVQFLVLLDKVRLVPEARGHGLGLRVLARAIKTWSREGIVAAIAAPFGDDDDDLEPAVRRAGCEALARHWQQLGFKRHADDEDEQGSIVLFAHTESSQFMRTVESHRSAHDSR